jgi:preprotein translocase subunit YajC
MVMMPLNLFALQATQTGTQQAVQGTPQAAQQAGPAPSFGGSSTMMLVFMFGIFIIFYLLLIMPARKKQKKHTQMVESLKSGDRIITTGGIHGTVMGTKQDRLEVKIASNTVIQITKSAVGAILPKSEKDKPA